MVDDEALVGATEKHQARNEVGALNAGKTADLGGWYEAVEKPEDSTVGEEGSGAKRVRFEQTTPARFPKKFFRRCDSFSFDPVNQWLTLKRSNADEEWEVVGQFVNVVSVEVAA